jgi:hypothetical protein
VRGIPPLGNRVRPAGLGGERWPAGAGAGKLATIRIRGEEIAVKRPSATLLGLLAVGAAALWSSSPSTGQTEGGWVTLFDGSNLDNWHPIGDADWKLADGVVMADKGNGYLVSNKSYKDFEIRAEFWVDADANSGVFIRCGDPQKVSASTCYEVNIFDKRPDPSYGTGAIVNVAKPSTALKAADKWNTYEITAKGSHFTVVLNGTRTVDNAQDDKHPEGPVALQYAAGVVKFRKVQIRPL